MITEKWGEYGDDVDDDDGDEDMINNNDYILTICTEIMMNLLKNVLLNLKILSDIAMIRELITFSTTIL